MKGKRGSKAMTVPGGLAVALAVSFAVTFLLSLGIAWLISGEQLGENAVGYGSLITLVTAAACGSVTAMILLKEQKLLMSLAAGGIYYIALLCLTALVFSNGFQGIGAGGFAILGGSGAVTLLSLRTRGGSGKRRYRYRG